MDWTAQIDSYCERLGPGFWAEPVNAITNGAFLCAALIVWRSNRNTPLTRTLCIILFVIGIGSTLFHTFATRWAALADTLPIAAFILTYLYAINRHSLGWPLWAAALCTLAFLPYAAGVFAVLSNVPFLRISGGYWAVPILLIFYASVLRNRQPALAVGFVAGAAILSLSISLRSLDAMLCASFPVGTHFLWHLLNATMLAIMIAVYRRHMLEAAPAGR